MMKDAKHDKEYETNISLEDGRPLPYGHRYHHSGERTDVAVMDKLLSNYFGDASCDTLCEFSDYKIDFALNYLDSIIIIMKDKYEKAKECFNEVERQSQAVSHRIIKPFLSGKPLTKEEKLEIYDLQEEILIKRRKIKDTLSVIGVFIDNTEKTRNFILGMNNRGYTPKADKFKNDDKYMISPARNASGIKTTSGDIKPIFRANNNDSGNNRISK